MDLNVTSALRDGLYRTFARNGLILVAAVFVANVVFQVGFTSLIHEAYLELLEEFAAQYPEFDEALVDPATVFPLAMDLPDAVSLGLLALGVVLTVSTLAVAVRVFATDATSTVPGDLVTDDIAWVTINLFVGSIVFVVLWVAGLLLVVVPGIVVYVLLVYFVAAVAVENRSFVDGMARSWRVTRGNRVRVFLLFLGYFLLTLAAGIAFGLVNTFLVLASPVLAELFSLLTNGLFVVYFAAVVAISFRQLTDGERGDGEEEGDPFDEFVPADRHAQW